jgi:hypothetical protein
MAAQQTPGSQGGRGRVGMVPFLTAGLGALLAIGTGVGVVQAVNSSSTDRVKPASVAPVYGSR